MNVYAAAKSFAVSIGEGDVKVKHHDDENTVESGSVPF
jgi:hypothetical protein